eukprot:6364348-Pyramimonas_sp.AAC.1
MKEYYYLEGGEHVDLDVVEVGRRLRVRRVYTQGGDQSSESGGYILRAGTNPASPEVIYSGRGPIRRVRRVYTQGGDQSGESG